MDKGLRLAEAQMAIQEVIEQLKLEQGRLNGIVSGIVKIHQAVRLAKSYDLSDALRQVLNAAGIEVIQGTAGYAYNNIPESLKGNPIGDTWKIKD